MSNHLRFKSQLIFSIKKCINQNHYLLLHIFVLWDHFRRTINVKSIYLFLIKRNNLNVSVIDSQNQCATRSDYIAFRERARKAVL